jgi:hypothetical protein
MAHLPIREEQGKINLAPTVQYCTRRASRYQRTATIMKVITAVGSVLILALLRFALSTPGPSLVNKVAYYAIVIIAAASSIAATLTSILNYEVNASRYETAIRAVRRLRDKYEFEANLNPDDPSRWKRLKVWGKKHVYEIEKLLEDSRVFDVDSHFKISDPDARPEIDYPLNHQ